MFFQRNEECEKFYKFGRVLGQGSFATVKMATAKSDNSKWAVKIIKRASLAPEDEQALATEVSIMERIKHPNIVLLKEVFDCPSHMYMVMELMTGGELFDRIVQKEHYSENEAKEAVTQLISAIGYCHDMGIVHRDLKPENLLYSTPNDDAVLKLADFGLAQLLKSNELMHNACGTPGYVAPEVLRNDSSGYGKEVDMWSVGVILYILLCGFPPFYDEDNGKLFMAIQKGEFDYPSPYWDDVSPEATDLIDKLLVLDPAMRLTAPQALEHPWLSSTDGRNTKLVHFAPNMRAFNARRRLRGAMRVIALATAMKKENEAHGTTA
jgi:calcium/calmodulin-dependent protein kinase I